MPATESVQFFSLSQKIILFCRPLRGRENEKMIVPDYIGEMGGEDQSFLSASPPEAGVG